MMTSMMSAMNASGMQGTAPGMGMGMTGSMPGMMGQMAPNMMMVPRCTMKVEKVAGGMKMTCMCDDPSARAMMQNLCQMTVGGMCSVGCMMNGMMVACCNLSCGMCKMEMTKDGCMMTCTSGDKSCEGMIQGCCDCIMACMKAGCTCCMMMGGVPVCCCVS